MAQKDDLKTLRHSAAHLLAHAISELHPGTKFTIGPATPNGFFYDVLPEQNFKEEELRPIEQRMREIANRDLPLEHKQIDKAEARALYKDNPFKLELIDEISGDTVGLATQGDFYDLCRGGHVTTTGQIKHVKLTGLSGSYWRADKSKQALQRISGTAFFTAKQLTEYEKQREEAAKYDHRRLGKELDLFSLHPEGPGFPFFHPKGQTVINLLKAYMRKEQRAAGYQEIETPIMLKDELWRRSGHYQHYKENMFFSNIDKVDYAVKPMNCPGAMLIYKNRPHSFRELPLRLSEFGKVHRYELSGVLHGLIRVRAFTQDDAHLYCTVDQLEQEILNTINLTLKVLKKFEFDDVKVAVSTKPDNAMGDDALWQQATQALIKSLKKTKVDHVIQEGEGAFYGPKIEFLIKDSMGREWQCSTVQVDFFQPQNFDLTYVASGGAKERPVVIHQAIYGSLERFFAILLEHYKGHLPVWLAPIQVKLLTITDEQKPYAQDILRQLTEHGIRATLDESSDPLAGKVKTAQLEKVPCMAVIGNKEVANKSITLRTADGKQKFGLSLQGLVEQLLQD